MLHAHGGVKRVLDEWEPEEFAIMVDNVVPLQFEPEVLQPEESLKHTNEELRRHIDELIQGMQVAPSPAMTKALHIVGLYIKSSVPWSASDDILANASST